MRIPKYVIDMMERSRYEFDNLTKSDNYAAGYTLSIAKRTRYQQARCFAEDLARLCKWADRNGGDGTAHILYKPSQTRHCQQYAVVTIFDPVMQHIEQYIKR